MFHCVKNRLRTLPFCVASCSKKQSLIRPRLLSSHATSTKTPIKSYTRDHLADYFVDPATVKFDDLKASAEFVQSLTKSESHKYERILTELEIFANFSEIVPPQLSDEDWKRCLTVKRVYDRIVFWEHRALYHARQKYKLEVVEKGWLEEEAKREQLFKEQERIHDAGGMGYAPNAYQHILNPLRDPVQMNLVKSSRIASAYRLPNPQIIVDLRPMAEASDKELTRVAIMLSNTIKYNSQSLYPIPVSFAGAPNTPAFRDVMKKRVKSYYSPFEYLKILPEISEQPPEKLFNYNPDEIAYISGSAKEYLDGPLDKKAYVICATSDKDNESLAYARKSNLPHYALPVKQHVSWHSGSARLTVNCIAGILREVNHHGDWGLALRSCISDRHSKEQDEEQRNAKFRWFEKLDDRNKLTEMIEVAMRKKYGDDDSDEWRHSIQVHAQIQQFWQKKRRYAGEV